MFTFQSEQFRSTLPCRRPSLSSSNPPHRSTAVFGSSHLPDPT